MKTLRARSPATRGWAVDAIVTVVAVADEGARRLFSDEFENSFPVGTHEGNNAYYGRNVLRGLVDGIDDFIHLRQQRWRQYRSLGPALLGSAMWINDEKLIKKLGEPDAACIVVNKPKRDQYMKPLARLNERTPGMQIRGFSGLTELAPKEDGQPALLGPS